MADWLKSIQSAGRGFRPGMEVQVLTGGTDSGKSIVFDIESDDFKPWRETFCPHYAEYRDFETGETYWKKFNRLPRSVDMYRADNIIRKNEDGTYEYVKNRATGELRQLTEEEAVWLILKAG
jgi:hypothetical protein